MRSTWSGMISFGLVNIPVGLSPATENHELSFNLLHAKDSGRIKNQRVCSVCGEVVAYSDLVKGYEYQKGSYVTLTDEDFAKVSVEATQSITIMDFVDISEIDPLFYETPYYIRPGKKAEAPYVLLREALRSTGKVGIAKVVLRSREHLGAIRVSGNALMLDTMHFDTEVRTAEGVPGDEIKVGKRELDMATMLIKAMTKKFEPEEYKDTYTEALQEVIDAKVEGKDISTPVEHKEPTNVIDIMAQLKASLERTQPAAKTRTRKIAV